MRRGTDLPTLTDRRRLRRCTSSPQSIVQTRLRRGIVVIAIVPSVSGNEQRQLRWSSNPPVGSSTVHTDIIQADIIGVRWNSDSGFKVWPEKQASTHACF